MVNTVKVIAEAKKVIGVPYRHFGRTVNGLDCSGLLYYVLNRSGISFPKTDGNSYTPRWWQYETTERYLNGLINNGFYIVDETKVKPGDVVTFRLFNKSAKINHSGILIDLNGNFIHPKLNRFRGKNGVQMESLEPSYIKRLAYYLRHKEYCYG